MEVRATTSKDRFDETGKWIFGELTKRLGYPKDSSLANILAFIDVEAKNGKDLEDLAFAKGYAKAVFGDMEGARGDFWELTEKSPDYIDGWYGLIASDPRGETAQVLWETGMRARRKSPRNPMNCNLLAEGYLYLGDFEKAAETFEECLQTTLNPYVEINEQRATLLTVLKPTPERLSFLARDIGLIEKSGDKDLVPLLKAQYAYLSGDYSKCLADFMELSVLYPNNPRIRLIAADCAYNLGKKEEARELARTGAALLGEGERSGFMPRLGVLLGEDQ